MGLDDMYDKPPEQQVPGNYMMDDRGHDLRKIDKRDTLNAMHNKSSNSSNKTSVESSNLFNTSNLDPYKKTTVGANGKVPKAQPSTTVLNNMILLLDDIIAVVLTIFENS